MLPATSNGRANPLTLALEGRPAATTRAYKGHVAAFYRWARANGVTAFDAAAVTLYKSALIAADAAPATVNQALSALRAVARAAGAVDILHVPNMRGGGRRLGHWLSKDEAAALWRSLDGGTLQHAQRRCIIALLLGVGLRRGELVGLTWDQIQRRDGRTWIVDLRGKGGKLRSVPLPAWSLRALEQWRTASGARKGRILRPAQYGRVSGDSMSGEAVRKAVAAMGAAVGLDIRPHDLRRTWAQLMYRGGKDIKQIGKVLGHSSVAVTEVYLGLKHPDADTVLDLDME